MTTTSKTLITPEIGKIYLIHHSSGNVNMTCVNIHHIDGFKSPHSNYRRASVTRYEFQNLKTGRMITIKSRVKVLKEIVL